MDKVKDTDAYLWYAVQTAKNGWSRNVLVHQIESGLYQRQALAEKISNFENRLPSPQSELAVQTMKDPYIFDFIPFKEDMVERDIERALTVMHQASVGAWHRFCFFGESVPLERRRR